MKPKTLTPVQALEKLLDTCALSEICTGEALERLARWGVTGKEAVEIVRKLIAGRYIDDERFARAYVRDRINHARWGRIKIRQSMRLKRLDSELIDRALAEEVDEDVYFANLAAALRQKAANMPEYLDQDCRAKLLRFAAQRGYEPGLIMEMLPEEDFWRRTE